MKQPSDRTRMLIHQLQSLPVENKDLFGRVNQGVTEQAVELINQIAKTKEWPSLIYLLPYLLTSQKEIAQSASDTIESLLEGIRPSVLLQLDDRLRGGMWSVPAYLSRWDNMKFSDLDKSISEKAHIGVIGITSFHRNGYVREIALKRLSGMTNGTELPFLLIRLSDWVDEVRFVAEHTVEERINSQYIRHFVDNLALLDRLKQRQRGGSGAKRIEIIERVASLLKQSPNRKFLLDSLAHPDYEVRRTCLKLLRGSPTDDWADIINRIILDKDLIANRRVALELSQNLSFQERLLTLELLVRDKAPSIRREALGALCEANSEECIEHVKASLIDGSAIVREYARWKLAKLESSFDIRQFYTQQLQGSTTSHITAAAALGLAECGRPEDARLVESLIGHRDIQVTKAAIRALAKLDGKNYTKDFLRLLEENAPGISNAAQNALERTLSMVSNDSLWHVLTTNSLWHAKRNVLRLLNKLSKWDRIGYLLLAGSHDDVHVRELATRYIESWECQYRFTWPFTSPTAKQQERLVSGMRHMNTNLSDQVRKTLQQCLKAYK